MQHLPEWNIAPAKEQNCTISFRADTAIGQSSQKTWHENFCRSAEYKFKSHEICPLEIKTSCQAGPGYNTKKESKDVVKDYTTKTIVMPLTPLLQKLYGRKQKNTETKSLNR